jgi:4-methyl-5(b-hydroxyethyl)-thiazole monophosphate biosynthesis
MELTITVDILRRAGIDARMVSVASDLQPVKGSRGIVMRPDQSVDTLDCGDLDMVVLPGGIEGTRNLGQSEKVIAALIAMNKNGKKIAAICAAPAVLVKAGILAGRHATSHPAAAEHMHGVSYSEARVVVDGNVITSRAAGTTFEFAFTLIEQLLGKEAAEAVNKGVLARI